MSNKPERCKFVLKHQNGTYFEKWTAIGPMFGATRDEAKRFDTRDEAARLLLDWRTGDSEVEVLIE